MLTISQRYVYSHSQRLPGGRQWDRRWSRLAVVSMLMCIIFMTACVRTKVRGITPNNLQAPQALPKQLAVYMPWFGDAGHIDVGYSSQDPKTLRRQIESARSAGISAFVVDWYGDRRPFLDKSFSLLQRAARKNHFQVALMYDETGDESGDATEDAIDALNKAYQAYIGPGARDRDAYFTHNGQPVIVIFPKQGKTNWNLVRARVNTWSTPPLLFYKDEAPAEFAAAFDGYYAWIHPGSKGWMADGSDWGKQYLEGFYTTMKNKYPDKIVMGGSWPGFDDSRANWGLNRHMDTRCGQTLADTTQLYHRYADGSASLPFLLVETWNDYEEGTAIERPNLLPCEARR